MLQKLIQSVYNRFREPDGTFYATSGKILGEAGDERKEQQMGTWSVYLDTKNPITQKEHPSCRCGFVADAYNQVVLSVDTLDNGQAKGAGIFLLSD